MTNVACFHGQQFAVAITLKGINTLREESNYKTNARYDLTSPQGKAILTSN